MYYIYQTMNKPTRIFTFIFSLCILWGCVSIPKELYVLNSRETAAIVTLPQACENVRLEEALQTITVQPAGLDQDGFTLLNWNLMKGNRDGWQEDFKKLSSQADLLIFQEARFSEPLRCLLQGNEFKWDMVTAFLINNDEVGVLNGSRIAPLFLCTVRYSEPLVAIPKTILVSLYPFRDSDQLLLAANVHLINFTLDTDLYSSQLQKLTEILVQHEGPLLVSGDFNTWNDERLGILQSFASRLGLSQVTFEGKTGTTFFGHVVDHVLYRGLEPSATQVIQVSSSDHNPLLVTFKRTQ